MAAGEGALEYCVAVMKGCLSKLSHCETRLMMIALRGHEFVRLFCQNVSEYDEQMDKVFSPSPLSLVKKVISLFFKKYCVRRG